ncbi:hypothetical protein GGS20DRAFT_587883 [Poronia punctata]|nr:hypothetical protein GGS20DRAFT_587883 [Poronia punctata]
MSNKQEQALAFQRIISQGRERKANEKLAAQIFNKPSQRQAGGPLKPGAGGGGGGGGGGPGSLASRVGVKKQRVSSAARIPAGNINGEWTHDLHGAQNGRKPQTQQQPAPNSLAARVQRPGGPLPKTRANNNRNNKLANAISRTAASPSNAQQQMNVVNNNNNSPAVHNGFTIRGLAGPFAVLAQNFAPGTTAADIESAMTPVGGLIRSCRLVKTHPILIAEIVFESKEGADRVIERFDKQTADGRTLSVYMKPGGYTPTAPRAQRKQNETRLAGNSVLVDGSMGFYDTMDMDSAGLYSDDLVGRR